MSRVPLRVTFLVLALAFAAGAGAVPAGAQGFPDIPLWAYPGARQEVFTTGPLDTIAERPRTVTLRWMRDPAAEARPDFGGYRIYRVTANADTARLMLIRRFSVNQPDSLFMWHFNPITALTPDPDRIATFVDPDSSGSFFKRCRRDTAGLCYSPGDSVIVLVPPPGPHDGFRTWYAITYEQRNTSSSDYLDLFIPDTLTCPNPNRATCPNLNHKARNFTGPVEPTGGPAVNPLRVAVVPNPYRAREAWDLAGDHEVHFTKLPRSARITIWTVSGDKVAELRHDDPVRDFARWNLRNDRGEPVSSGVYVFRVESDQFSHQDRFVVIR